MRFQSLDGWRGIAAILVSLYHLGFLHHFYEWDFLRNSYLFVDFFFVLSGFVITHAYQNRLNNAQDAYHFIVRRIARLFPLHIFVLLLFVGLELIKLILVQLGSWNNDAVPFTGQYSIASLVSNVFLIQSLGIHNNLTWNYPSWSISVEFYTYLVFAFVAITSVNFTRFKHLLKIQTATLIALCFIILYVNTDNLSQASYNFGIFRCIAGFFLGSICYKIFLAHKELSIPQASLIEISLLVSIYFFITFLGMNQLSILAPLLFALTVMVFSYEQGVISKVLKIKSIQNLGKWSYSIYMLHAFLILVIGRIINVIEGVLDQKLTAEYAPTADSNVEVIYFFSPYLMDLLTILYVLILVALASFTYKHIELKGNKLFNKNETEKSKQQSSMNTHYFIKTSKSR